MFACPVSPSHYVPWSADTHLIHLCVSRAASLEGKVSWTLSLRLWVGQLCNNICTKNALSFAGDTLHSPSLSLKAQVGALFLPARRWGNRGLEIVIQDDSARGGRATFGQRSSCLLFERVVCGGLQTCICLMEWGQDLGQVLPVRKEVQGSRTQTHAPSHPHHLPQRDDLSLGHFLRLYSSGRGWARPGTHTWPLLSPLTAMCCFWLTGA